LSPSELSYIYWPTIIRAYPDMFWGFLIEGTAKYFFKPITSDK